MNGNFFHSLCTLTIDGTLLFLSRLPFKIGSSQRAKHLLTPEYFLTNNQAGSIVSPDINITGLKSFQNISFSSICLILLDRCFLRYLFKTILTETDRENSNELNNLNTLTKDRDLFDSTRPLNPSILK